MKLNEAVAFYRANPVRFVTDIIGAQPEDYQADILNSIRDNAMTTVRSGHGTGKTAVESWAAIWYLIFYPFARIPCTAPTQHQLHDILWAEMAKWIYGSPCKSELVWTKEKIWIHGYASTWFAVARTASDPNALQGFHGENLFFIIDEASGVDDAMFHPVLGALTEENAKLLMCGNPTELSGFFYDSHHDQSAMYRTFVLDSAKSNRVSEKYVQTIIEMFGIDSDPYRVRVAGEFPKAMADSFISREWIEQCLTEEEPDIVRIVDIGVDVARFGDDETVVYPVVNKRFVKRPEIIRKNDTMQVAGTALAVARKYRDAYGTAVRVKIDCDGLGVGVYDRIREVKDKNGYQWLELIECHFGGKGGKLRAGDPLEFANGTGLMWGTLRNKLKNGDLVLRKDGELIAQFTNRKYRLNSDGQIVLERKEEMKKRGVRSPDRADALAMALYDKPKAQRIGVINFEG